MLKQVVDIILEPLDFDVLKTSFFFSFIFFSCLYSRTSFSKSLCPRGNGNHGYRQVEGQARLSTYLDYVCLSIFIPVVSTWSMGHPWNAVSLQFLNHKTVGRTPWTEAQPVARPLPTHRTQTQNIRRQTSMPWVGFEPTITVFERAKAFHSFNRAAALISAYLE
jgi:hypothetical protein